MKRIIGEKTIDDGTTTGHKVYIDSDGCEWVPTNKTKDACGTLDNVASVDDKGFIWEILN